MLRALSRIGHRKSRKRRLDKARLLCIRARLLNAKAQRTLRKKCFWLSAYSWMNLLSLKPRASSLVSGLKPLFIRGHTTTKTRKRADESRKDEDRPRCQALQRWIKTRFECGEVCCLDMCPWTHNSRYRFIVYRRVALN